MCIHSFLVNFFLSSTQKVGKKERITINIQSRGCSTAILSTVCNKGKVEDNNKIDATNRAQITISLLDNNPCLNNDCLPEQKLNASSKWLNSQAARDAVRAYAMSNEV